MNTETIIAVNIGLSIISALAAFLLNDKRARMGIVSVTALTLIASSLLLFHNGGAEFSLGHSYETALVALDFALLLYFLYQGFRSLSWQVIVLSLGQLVPAAYFEFILKGGHVETALVVDGLSILLTLIINVIGSIVLIYALGYMDEHESHQQEGKSRQNLFFFYLVLLLGAMNGLVYSNSLYWLYFFWEVTTLCCYELIRYERTEEATENGLRALWMGLVGGVAIVRVEQPRGECFYYAVGNGTIHLERMRIRTPTLPNSPPLLHMLKGYEISDIPAIVHSIDPCMACAERITYVKKGGQ